MRSIKAITPEVWAFILLIVLVVMGILLISVDLDPLVPGVQEGACIDGTSMQENGTCLPINSISLKD